MCLQLPWRRNNWGPSAPLSSYKTFRAAVNNTKCSKTMSLCTCPSLSYPARKSHPFCSIVY